MSCESKNITFQIQFAENTRNSRTDILRTADLCFDSETKLNSVFGFISDLRSVLAGYRRCLVKGNYCVISLSVGQYNIVNGQVTTSSFDYWKYEGFPDDNSGFYLRADERYTSPDLDLWIDLSRSIYDMLSELSI